MENNIFVTANSFFILEFRDYVQILAFYEYLESKISEMENLKLYIKKIAIWLPWSNETTYYM